MFNNKGTGDQKNYSTVFPLNCAFNLLGNPYQKNVDYVARLVQGGVGRSMFCSSCPRIGCVSRLPKYRDIPIDGYSRRNRVIE